MSVELLNNSVLLPHDINWRDRPRGRRQWRTEESEGVTGAADRASGRTGADRTFEWTLTTYTVPSGARLRARLLAALKKGRACAPFWGRAQTITGPDWTPRLTSPTQYTVSNLTPTAVYYWRKGVDATVLINGLDTVRHSGYFTAASSEVTIDVTHTWGDAGTVAPDAQLTVLTDGLWPWAVDENAFFIRRASRDQLYTHENKALKINAAGSATGGFAADVFYYGGTVKTTGTAINRSAITGFAAPSEAIYQSARNLTSMDPADQIQYILPGYIRDVPCRVRLHFAEIEAGFDRTTAKRLFDLTVAGATTIVERNFEPYGRAGNTLHKATSLDFVLLPDNAGNITITLQPVVSVVRCATVTNHDLSQTISTVDGVSVNAGDRILFRNQTNAREHGIRIINQPAGPGGIHPRAEDADESAEVAGLTVYVQEGGLLGNSFWRCTTQEPIIADNDPMTTDTEIEFDTADYPYNAGINAIEVYQYQWETVPLTSGTGVGTLKFAENLKGVYEIQSGVYPCFFGRPRVRDMAALRTDIAELRVTIEEPLGSGEPGVAGTCPVESCNDDGLFTNPILPLDFGTYPSCGGGFTEELYLPTFEPTGGGTAREMGLACAVGPNPIACLSPGVGNWWALLVWQKWTLEEIPLLGFTPVNPKLVWQDDTGFGFPLRYQSNQVFGGYYFAASGYNWTLGVRYCKPV